MTHARVQMLRLAGVLAGIGLAFVMVAVVPLTAAAATTQAPADGLAWIASWTTSMHGPYPAGNMVAQPVLDFAIASADEGARDQTLRQIIRPDLWGRTVRLHLANTFGTRAITFDDVFVGLQATGAAVAAGTN